MSKRIKTTHDLATSSCHIKNLLSVDYGPIIRHELISKLGKDFPCVLSGLLDYKKTELFFDEVCLTYELLCEKLIGHIHLFCKMRQCCISVQYVHQKEIIEEEFEFSIQYLSN